MRVSVFLQSLPYNPALQVKYGKLVADSFGPPSSSEYGYVTRVEENTFNTTLRRM
jgi:hypothetical protein